MKFSTKFYSITFKLVFFLLISCNALWGQKNNAPLYAEGEFLVQMAGDYSIESLVDVYTPMCGLQVVEQCSQIMKIWRLSYDNSTCDHAEMRRLIGEFEGVEVVQNNHIIYKRQTFPNEYVPWPVHNPTTNADIDGPEAWDYDTGDTTAQGDQIVVAIVDGGFDLTDTDASYWTNTNEIPGNGIDDDNNGYIDDHLGWSVIDSTDNVQTITDFHGHNVSKRAARKGNNGMGGATINWNVLTMPILIFGSNESLESRAIAGMDYVINERIIYDSTGGVDGAFVVATNHSYGSGGWESDAPLWCAIYATAGSYGILNCGATSNGPDNVDVTGDLPTTCSQEHLIAVTQTDDNDNLDAGYGATYIDLGSPSEGSTSMATPLVTGTIALLLSAACDEFIQAYKDYPDSVSLLVRDYIFDGTDSVNDLIGTTVTGGRLNAFNSLALMLEEQCGVPFPPVVDFTANKQQVCVGDTVQFTDISQLLPNSWNWTINGGVPGTSTLQNPEAVFNTPGTYSVSLSATNGSGTTSLNINDLITVVSETGNNLPYSQNFENSNDWTVNNPNGDATWDFAFNDVCNDTVLVMDNFGDNNTGTSDFLTSSFDLTGFTNAQLSFDVAYAPYNATYSDQLNVTIQSCGMVDSMVYSKDGPALATAPDITTGFVPADCSEWRSETIDLSFWDGEVVFIQFENFSNWGNFLYLDNIEVTGTPIAASTALSLTLLLEGAYDANGAMNANLGTVLPNGQPYNAPPYNYMGGEQLPSIPLGVVDWILIEAREGTPSLIGNRSTTTIETQAALLLSNGEVLAADGISPLVFNNLLQGQEYHLCIRHRNHLDILSNAIVAQSSVSIDFTSSIGQALGVQQMKLSSDGYAFLFAGDFTQDGVIQNTDYDQWKIVPALLDNYQSTDGNLDGTVQTTDYDVWFPNKAKIGIPEIAF